MAGAGTGKTETMSERLLFLLSTSRANAPAELRLTDVAIITFSREAAAQIARRVASTLSLRRRLCPRNVHPVLAWLTQVGAARISTIHQFARHIIAVSGARIGLSPEFTISSGTLRLRELVTDALAVPLADLYRAHDRRPPPVHEWRQHIEAVWDALQNNGVRLMEELEVPCVRWGPQGKDLDAADRAIIELVQRTIDEVRTGFRDRCIEEQFLPTGQLIPWARRVLDAATGGPAPGDGQAEPAAAERGHPDLRFRHLFVDEFQDTDEEQLQLVLAIRRHLGAHLFVVGDVKQGIYRFRGAAGNAFNSLDQHALRLRLTPPKRFTLTRNFRTGRALLDSLHPHFRAWRRHAMRLLDYEESDRLTPDPGSGTDRSAAVSIRRVADGGWEEETAGIIRGWRDRDPEGRLAVLCRRNSDARKIYAKLSSLAIPCDIRTGHDFYQSNPVHETRAFLEAVIDPDDPAALLELLETRWGVALMLRRTTLRTASSFDWEADVAPISTWDARLAWLAHAPDPRMADLDSARARVSYLAAVAREMSPLAFLILCRDLLRPEDHGGGVEGDRYGRSIDHLVTLMDEQFADAPVTLGGLIGWLRDRIATDDTEDGPPPDDDGKGIVRIITVHRAKGLEFDRVIIANTNAMFGAHQHVTTVATVLSDPDGSHRALWRWKERGKDTWGWQNPDGGDAAWRADALEIRREEARLLYVAMTRAKHELVILRSGRRRDPMRPERWSDLIDEGLG
jgi:DNA helicase-2/ATP-dependent DNA helicase PcrA